MSLLVVVLLAAACVKVAFRRPPAPLEMFVERELRSYFLDVARVFAAGDADGLAALYDPAIAKPMTRDAIRAWAVKFFAENGPARFHVDKFTLESVGAGRASATLAYRVTTASGKGNFGGTEYEEFRKSGERWLMTAWEKVP